MTDERRDAATKRVAVAVVRLAEWTLDSQSQLRRGMGHWEAEWEAYNIILLAASHAASAGRLALDKLRLAPSGCALARVCLESGARALWLLHSDEPFQREANWLTYLLNGAYNREQLGKRYQELGVEGTHVETAKTIRSFVSAVRAKLPEGVVPPAKYPDLRKVLKEAGHERKYVLYTQLSQQTHSTHLAGSAYARNLGTMKGWGEYSAGADWQIPLATCWWSLATPSTRLAEVLEVPRALAVPASIEEEYVAAYAALEDT